MINISGIGMIMRDERRKKKYSLEILAEKTNIARQTLSKWEKGAGSPAVDDLLKLCEVYDCDFGYLIGEYPCRKRIYSDIQSETGLSEAAIENLVNIRNNRKNVSASAKIMILNAILEDETFLDHVSNVLYALYMIPENSIANISFYGADKSTVSTSILGNDNDLRRLYMADIQNIIFNFLNRHFIK